LETFLSRIRKPHPVDDK